MVVKENYLEETTVTQVVREMLAEINRIVPIHQGKIQPQSCALLVIDMQRLFLDGQTVPSAPAIIPYVNRLIEAFRLCNRPIIFTRHINSEADAGMMEQWWGDLISPDDPRSMLDERIDTSSDTIITKPQYDAFYQTNLEEMLRQENVTQVVICGVVTHLCCETTARSAFVRGFSVIMPPDATASYNRQLHQASLLTLCHGFISPLPVTDCLNNMGIP